MSRDHRYATSRGLVVWHVIDMGGVLPNAFAPALCGARPAGTTWIGYAGAVPSGQQACAECERLQRERVAS